MGESPWARFFGGGTGGRGLERTAQGSEAETLLHVVAKPTIFLKTSPPAASLG